MKCNNEVEARALAFKMVGLIEGADLGHIGLGISYTHRAHTQRIMSVVGLRDRHQPETYHM